MNSFTLLKGHHICIFFTMRNRDTHYVHIESEDSPVSFALLTPEGRDEYMETGIQAPGKGVYYHQVEAWNHDCEINTDKRRPLYLVIHNEGGETRIKYRILLHAQTIV